MTRGKGEGFNRRVEDAAVACTGTLSLSLSLSSFLLLHLCVCVCAMFTIVSRMPIYPLPPPPPQCFGGSTNDVHVVLQQLVPIPTAATT